MSTLTPNYNLIKPELTDSIPLTIGNDLGANFAIIDSAMNGNRTDLDIIRTAVSDTGTVNNIVVDTAGTFNLTKNGNILTVIPLFTNTNATVNISVDGQANKLIKKANDAGTLVALEVGDLKKNVPCQLVWDSVNDFFILAPKSGGDTLKAWKNTTQYNNPLLGSTSVTNRLTVNGSGWVIAMTARAGDSIRLTIDGVVVIGSPTQSVTLNSGSTRFVMFRFNTSFTFASASDFTDFTYVLGDKFYESQLYLYGVNSGAATTSRLNVTGKGWLFAINNPSSGQSTKLVVDGITAVNNKSLSHGFPMIKRFESGFELFSNNDFINATYVLD